MFVFLRTNKHCGDVCTKMFIFIPHRTFVTQKEKKINDVSTMRLLCIGKYLNKAIIIPIYIHMYNIYKHVFMIILYKKRSHSEVVGEFNFIKFFFILI